MKPETTAGKLSASDTTRSPSQGRPRAASAPEAVSAQVGAIVDSWLRENRPPIRENGFFLERIERLASVLALWGVRANLTARPTDAAEIAFHVIDSLAPLVLAETAEGRMLAGIFDEGGEVLDIGSGAGFPGLVLAAGCRARFTLAEARRKRASFLNVAAAEMGLRNAAVSSARAAPATLRARFDAVTTRALGDYDNFLRMASKALRPGGVAVVFASPSMRFGLQAARAQGFSHPTRIAYAVGRGSKTVERTLVVWRKNRAPLA